jgi:hypothetical protein
MQSFTVLATSDTLSTSRTYLNDNFTTLNSNNSGTSFPATNLVVGMFCYRTDLGATYQLKSTGPSVWVLMFDNDETYLSQQGGDARYAYDYASTVAKLGFAPANKTGDTFTGPVVVQAPVAADAASYVLADGGYNAFVLFGTRASLMRWGIFKNAIAEGGSNAGSNLQIARYNDAGSYLGLPFEITRSTGRVTFETAPYVGADKIWHQGNDGAASGLDADTIDGVDSATLLMTGTEKQTTARIYPAVTALTDGATITWNLSLGPMATVTLGGNRTLAFSGTIRAGTYVLKVKQDATGSRTLAYPATVKTAGAAGITLSTGVNKEDIITFVSDGTNMYAVCVNDLR